MAPIVASIEIDRPPDEVFSYVTDPSRLAEWQESVVRSRVEGGGTAGVGQRVRVTRRVGRREQEMTAELAELEPPTRWAVRGIDGPVRGDVNGTVEPIDAGARSRVTITLDLHGHGIGKLLLPLVVRPQARKEMVTNIRNLKQKLERAT